MTKYPLLCGKNTKLEEEKRAKKGKRVATLEEKKIMRWAVDDKKDWKREEKVEVDHRKIKKNGATEIFKVEKGVWKDRIRKDANKENLGSCYRPQRDVQTMKRKDLSSI